MTEVLKVVELRKNYGKKEALRGVSFSVNKGEIYGLIGPNGAGKTTTLRIIATLLKPSGGNAYVNGISVTEEPSKVREMISYLPEEAGAYPGMTGLEYLEFIAKIYYDDPKEIKRAVDRGVEIAGLGDSIYERTKTYSKGMKRRLQLARALMVSPQLALLDEPTSGIDVIHAMHLRRKIREYVRENNVGVLMSSHNLSEVQSVCDRVGLIYQGRIIEEGSPGELMGKYGASNLESVFAKVVGL